MTIQDDLSRPWFQPVVPSSGAEQEDSGPPTTRIAGSLPLDEVIAETPAAPTPPDAAHPAAPNPAPAPAPPPNQMPMPAEQPRPAPPAAAQPPMAPPPTPEHVEVTQPYIPAIREEQPEFAKRLNPDVQPSPSTVATGPQPAVQPGRAPDLDAPAPVRKRSLMRRVVRKIIGPDLLRKDPPKKKR
ncbi:hypothetical protein GCM10009854_32450 [Saccharopolyspora halophila]|uniref:Uncharacterized protein n=1 Tax=Saccharopolyspora halophila TaxID=405551 RepID=A0ABN3GI90_9PSEU